MLTAEELEELKAIEEMESAKAPARSPGQIPYDTSGMTPEEAEEFKAILEAERSLIEQAPSAAQPMKPGIKEEEIPRSVWSAGLKPGERTARLATEGEARAYAEGAGNEVSLGYLPQIQAFAEKYLIPNPTAEVDAQLRAEGFVLPERGYVQMRDENIQSAEALAQQYPDQAAIGKATGIATTMAPIARGLKGLKLAGDGATRTGRVVSGFGGGAAISGAYNPGDIEGQVNPLQLADRGSNAAKGGFLGLGGQALAEGGSAVTQTIKNSAEYFDKLAKTKAFKAAGAMLKDFRQARGDKAAEEIGDTLLKKNIVQAGDGVEEIAAKTAAAKNEAGEKIRGIYSQVKEFISKNSANLSEKERKILDATKLNGKGVAEKIRGKLGQYQKNNLGNTEVKGKMDEILGDLENMGDDIDLSDLLSARNSLDDRINYSKKMGELPLLQKQMSTARQEITKAIQDRVRAVGAVTKDKNLINELRTANKEYGQLSTVERFATDKIARENANRFFSLGDRVTSGAGATIGALSGDTPEERIKNGLIGFVGGRVAAKYGRHSTALAAKGAQQLGKALKQPANFAKFGEPLIEAAKRSPEELQALLQQLSNNPEFQKLATQGAK